jgi:hypothetical protein
MLDSQGRTDADKRPMRIRAKYKGWCGLCLYTVWPKEQVEYKNKKVYHLDCEAAIRDGSHRRPKDLMHEDNVSLEKDVLRRKILARNG